ncbi:MAG: hypothetical protein ACPGUI_06565, partial [Halarcobacter sp.]
MTIRQRLFISFSLILLIILSIIGVFFYTIFNLSEIHKSQTHRYDQIRRVEKLKEYNNSFSWIVLDIVTDYEKMDVVKKRLEKSDKLFKTLIIKKRETIENSESIIEKQNLQQIFQYFEEIEKLIKYELYELVLISKDEKNFTPFNKNFEKLSFKID